MNLEESLVNARRFMDHDKLQANGNVKNDRNEYMQESQESVGTSTEMPYNTQQSIPQQSGQPQSMPQPPSPGLTNMNPHSNITEQSIRNSRLPDAIKEAMISHPIPDAQTGPTMDSDFINKVSEKMNNPQYGINQMRNTSNSDIPVNRLNEKKQTPSNPSPIPSPNVGVDSLTLKEEIKGIISESLDELIENKINKSLLSSVNVKENLQFRVGNKIFTGKISKVRTIKN